ncbi:MAG: glycoside hydrolase family 28 protein [Bryobacteraceae bacterium]
MAVAMNTFDSARRDLLKIGSMGLAASAAAALPAFAAAQSTGAAGSATPTFFDVRAFGATGDGKTVDSPAINRAIEAAAAAGGGTVVFPRGNYVSFSIRLKSHVGLYLSQGSAIIAAESPLPGQTTGYMGGTYDAAEPNTAWDAYQDYGHNHWHNSLIWGENLSDVSIAGPGLIWGKGLSFGAGRAARGGYPIYRAEQPGAGNKSIALKSCRNVTLRDFSILKGGHFGLLLTGVDNLTIDNLKIDTDRDGMDIDCCKNVHVSNCTVNSPWDDGICPKSSYALGFAKPTQNVTIADCYVTGCWELGSVLDGTFKRRGGGTGRIKCGTESNGGFINIAISNCVFEGCGGLALETVDGALLEDITVTNLTMRDINNCPIFLRLGARLRGPKESTKVGTLRRVLINNVNSFNTPSRYSSILSGIPGYAIEDVKLSDIYVQHAGGAPADSTKIQVPEYETKYPEPGMFGPTPSQGFFLRHMKNVEVSHAEIEPVAADPRASFYLEDVHRADFVAVTAPSTPPAFSFNNSSDVRIRISRAAPDSTTP